jgi:RNA polymerase sigma-70 factor (ECF subfamily)
MPDPARGAGARTRRPVRRVAATGVMSRDDELAATFLAALIAVAYAILGSHAEADDVVADAWPRLIGADGREPIRDVTGRSHGRVARIDFVRAPDKLRRASI